MCSFDYSQAGGLLAARASWSPFLELNWVCFLFNNTLWHNEVKLVSDQSALLLGGCRRALDFRQGSVQRHGGLLRCCVPVCPLGVSVALCCFSSPVPPRTLNGPAPQLSVRFLRCCETFSVNCLCFLSFFFLTSPNTRSLSVYLYFCSSFTLLLSLLSSHSPSLSLVSHLLPSGLCCAVAAAEAIGTDGVRWFPGSTHFYRKQPGRSRI